MPTPPPVPALPDTQRISSYTLSSQTGPFAVNFAIYGDGTDYANWIHVYLGENLLNAGVDYTLSSPSGTLGFIALPITDAQVTLTVASSGTLTIVGARRPRRIQQFAENRGVAARDLNQAITDVVAENRENWDLLQTRALLLGGISSVSGSNILPVAALRANKVLTFDNLGNPLVQAIGGGGGGGSPPGGIFPNIQYNAGGGLFGGLTDVQVTARIQTFSTTLSGAVPASGAATGSKFLNDAGNFTTPAGGSPTPPGGSNLQIQYNNSGSFGGLTDVQVTARIQTFSTTLSGAVPAPGSVAGKVLSDNGTWIVNGGGAGTPGGALNTIQYNNGGAFGGMSGSSWDDTNRALTMTGATVTTSHPFASWTQTWNGVGVNFTGSLVNITDSNSAATSKFMDWQLGGVSKFSVVKDGSVNATKAINLAGTTSGIITIAPQAAAGTYNFNLPTTVGVAGQLLQSQGGGASPMLWTATPILGSTSIGTGSLGFAGATSGVVTVVPQAIAGAYSFNLPTTAGTAGQFLTSQGGGGTAMTWTTGITGPGTTTKGSPPIWNTITGGTVIDGRGIINIMAFGADPTGASASDTALANTLTSIGTDGGIVYIPKGTYKLTTTWNVTNSNITVLGDGPNSIIQQSTLSVDAIANSGSNNRFTNFQIKYPSLASAGYGLNNSGAGTLFSNVYDNLHVVNAFNAIRSHNENVAFYTNIFASSVVNNGFFFDATSNVVLNTFDFSEDAGNYHTSGIGIYMPGACQGCLISNGEIFSFNRSLSLGGVSGLANAPAYCQFMATYFNNGWQQDLISTGYDLSFVECEWSNGAKPGGDNGLGITGGDLMKFTNCDFVICGAHGCLVQAGVTNTAFVACSFISNSQLAGSGVSSGLVFGAAVTDFVVQGCIVKNDSNISGTANQKYGILVSAGASDRYIIQGNLISTNVTGGVLDSGTGLNKLVSGNF
jgi:hypothetical protein